MHDNVLLKYKCTRQSLVLDLRGKNKIYNFWWQCLGDPNVKINSKTIRVLTFCVLPVISVEKLSPCANFSFSLSMHSELKLNPMATQPARLIP